MFRRAVLPRLLIIFILIALIISVFSFGWIENNLKPTILSVAEAQAEVIATEAVNDAINEKIANDVEYKDLIYYRTDTRGRIVLMQPNTVKINNLAADMILEVQRTLKKLEKKVFYIPVGQALGSELLANYGPRIQVNLVPIGTVTVKVIDDFEEAGINQTRHRVFLNVNTKVKIVIPLVSKPVTVAAQVPIAETLIVGEVPDTYMKFNVDKMLEGQILGETAAKAP